MPKFNVEHLSGVNAQDAFEKLKIFLNSPNDISKLDSEIACQFDDQKLTATMTGSQFKAQINVRSQTSGSKTVVVVDIPLLLLPFKSKIQETLERQFKKHLG